jgi:predicted nuclease of restriction endonuclease-like RecB superfamily
MRCTLKDVRFTVRQAGGDDPIMFPRLLRDRSILPKIDFAIDYFERLVGHERRDLDAELLVSFFGDHKLARCLIAALTRSYRFRPRRIDEVVSKASARRLAASGIAAPKLLRLALFDEVNEHRGGFTGLDEREAACADLARRLKVRPAEVEGVLYLDLDEHAVLRRAGPRARTDDVVAEFNLGVLEVLLRQAESVELRLATLPSGAGVTAQKVGAAYGVAVTVTEQTLRLVGRQDALGNWSRHGRRLARAALDLLERGQGSVVDGLAVLALPNRRVRLRLTPEILTMLSVPDRGPADWQDDLDVREAILERVGAEVHRRPGEWSLRRRPDARAASAGVTLPDLQLRKGDRLVVVTAVRSVAHASRAVRLLDRAAAADLHIFVGTDETLAPLREAGATVIRADAFDIAALEASL